MGSMIDPVKVAQRAICSVDLALSARIILAWLALAHGGRAWLLRREVAESVGLAVKTALHALSTLQRVGAVTISECREDRRREYAIASSDNA